MSVEMYTGWTPTDDDGCRWVLDVEGGPLPVSPCPCGSVAEIYGTVDSRHHKVTCPKCGKTTLDIIGGSLLATLKLWNRMVDSDEARSSSDHPRTV